MGNALFDKTYKRDMKGMLGDFYRRSNAVVANFSRLDRRLARFLFLFFSLINYDTIFIDIICYILYNYI